MRILALDCGTHRIKAGVFDISSTPSAKRPQPSAVKAPVRLWIEDTDGPLTEQTLAGRDRSHLDVDSYFNRVFNLLRRVSTEIKEDGITIDILCPAVSSPSLVALDSQMRPVYPALTHLHRASQPQAKELAASLGHRKWLEKVGNLPLPGAMSISSLRWLAAKQPHVLASTSHWIHLHSLLLYKLTGNLVTDPTQAACTGVYDILHSGGWLDDQWLETMGLRRNQLPEIVPSVSIAGKLKSDVSNTTGLPQGLPVVTGGADIPTGLLAAEELFPGCALNMSGTMETVAASSELCPKPRENCLLWPHLLPGRWVAMKVSPVGGETLHWFQSRFCREMSQGRFWDWVVRLDLQVERNLEEQELTTEAEGAVEFIPYLFGSPHSLEEKKGGFIGLTAESTREDMLIAVLVAFRRYLREAARDVAASVDRPLERVVTSGGYDISSLGFHRRAALSRAKLTPLEASVVRGAAILAARALEES